MVDLDDLDSALGEAAAPVVGGFDVDNTLVPQGAAPGDSAFTVAHTKSRFEAASAVGAP